MKPDLNELLYRDLERLHKHTQRKTQKQSNAEARRAKDTEEKQSKNNKCVPFIFN